jgi:excisionase family DNA binding protein
MEKDLLGTSEAAALLGVSARRILKMIENGQLAAQRVGGFSVLDRADVEKLRDRPGRGRPVTLPADKRRKKSAK